MDERAFRNALSDLPLGGLRYFDVTVSTNDVALAWAATDAHDLSLVYAEEQTGGRGRGSHTWFTPPGAALAFTLILKPHPTEASSIPLFSALGALAVSRALEELGLHPQIKWPNDVLIGRRKVSGILAESVWLGDEVDSVVLGIGVNVSPASVPPVEQLAFPATCLEAELSPRLEPFHGSDRLDLLIHILRALIDGRPGLGSIAFFREWEQRLAFRQEPVEVWNEGQPPIPARLEGLDPDGSLRLRSETGETFTIRSGELHLRPVV